MGGVTDFPNVKATSPTSETYCWGNVLGFVTRCHETPPPPLENKLGGCFAVSVWFRYAGFESPPSPPLTPASNKNQIKTITNICVFIERGRAFLREKKEAPARDARHRRPCGFDNKSTIFVVYPRQNDANDGIYPMGPSKPVFFHIQNYCNLFYGKCDKHIFIINNFIMFAVFSPLRGPGLM